VFLGLVSRVNEKSEFEREEKAFKGQLSLLYNCRFFYALCRLKEEPG
jgi:hypothetical protein